MRKISVGSVCSGIEAASVAWGDLGFDFKWFSEIATFPSQVLAKHYPDIPNLGDMCAIPDGIANDRIDAPDLICGGTPCQAFSLAGWKKGLTDDRGNLTLKFVDIIDANDAKRAEKGADKSVVFWENVEGVLRDKTNVFGQFLARLAGVKGEFEHRKWPNAGVIYGATRNIAWRILDAKYFGLPHQRRRLYVIAGGKDFYPENILFDSSCVLSDDDQSYEGLTFSKDGHMLQVFRAYTDCLYAAYGTKWNGNAAAYNGSLFVAQNNRLRRFSPLECERLMGLPDGYTDLPKARPTNRYQAVGNSWAVPVIRWVGQRIVNYTHNPALRKKREVDIFSSLKTNEGDDVLFYAVEADRAGMNGSERPENPVFGRLSNVIDVDAPENFYITPVGCKGILRRKEERNLSINPHLERVLAHIASQWADDKIEAVSRRQKRGRFSDDSSDKVGIIEI